MTSLGVIWGAAKCFESIMFFYLYMTIIEGRSDSLPMNTEGKDGGNHRVIRGHNDMANQSSWAPFKNCTEIEIRLLSQTFLNQIAGIGQALETKTLVDIINNRWCVPIYENLEKKRKFWKLLVFKISIWMTDANGSFYQTNY